MISLRPYADLSDDQLQAMDVACGALEQALQNAVPFSIEEQIREAPEDIQGLMFRELLAIGFEFRIKREGLPDLDEYLARFPGSHDDVRQAFQEAKRSLDDSARGMDTILNDRDYPSIGSVVGPYKLKELIGEGGMGLVFAAEQDVPVRREVALKLIKFGMDTQEVINRFEAERQALALMDHPHIARVLNAGATETGRPYFVMELIRGVPVTDYCNERKLSTRSRLELFMQICRAVWHAHQKGIIHRDIKPSNILVTSHNDVPVPKVIDFGVAKAIGQRLTERTIRTRMSQLVGTPMYMSPEQAAGSALGVDTRTDIYSLGVVLYELLTGTTPFAKDRLSDVGYDELRRFIRDEEPPRPSQRLTTLDAKTQSTISNQRAAGQQKLTQTLRGELDWIVMKAMEKEVSRRYESAGEFAADIRRYLADEPVLACPPSARYRLGKYARRHKVALLLATFVIVGLATGMTGLIVSNVLITRQKNVAEFAQNEEKAQRLEAERQQERADENFRLARRAIDRDFTLVREDTLLNRPELAHLRKALIENAVEFYESLLDRLGNDDVLDVAAFRRDLANFVPMSDHAYGTRSETLETLRIVQRLREALVEHDPNNREILAELADTIWYIGYLTEDPQLMRDGISKLIEADLGGLGHRAVLAAYLEQLGWRLMSLGQWSEAAGELQKSVSIYKELAREFPDSATHDIAGRSVWSVRPYSASAQVLTSELARALLNSGQRSAAEQLAMELEPRSGSDFVARGSIYKELRQDDQAIADYMKALEVGLSGHIPHVRRVGEFLDQVGQHEKAILFFNYNVDVDPDPSVSRTYASRGAAWAHLKQYDKAIADFASSIEIGASSCEHHLARMEPAMLRESPAAFQTQFLQLADRAVELTGGYAEAFFARAQVQLALGQTDEARADLSRGIEKDPDLEVPSALRPLLQGFEAETSTEQQPSAATR